MSKKLRKILTFMASLGLLVTLSLAVAACGGDDWKIETSVNETPAGGRMLSILDGVPAPSLGQEGDVCLVGETGELYLKSEQGWTRTEYTDYSVSGNALTVRYANGTTGEYSLAQSEGACEHALGDLIPVYETKCYIPGIGLRTCTKCGETFPEIIPATGHQFAEDGKTCLICDEYHIKSLAELGEFRDSVNEGNAFEGKTVYLDCNIVFPAAATVRPRASRIDEPVTVAAWEPIGTAEAPFKGTFEGCGRSISNLTCEGKDNENAGLFGVTENATVRNLKLLKADVTVEDGSAGALIGEAKGTLTVSGVTVVGSTVKAEEGHESNHDVGTLVGKMEGSGTVTVKDVTVRTEETPDASTSDAKTELTQDLIGGETKPAVQYEGKTEFTVALADGFAERLVSDNGDTQKWYEITSAAGLAAFRDSVNGTGGMEYKTYETETVKLAADIDLNNAPWTPIGEHGKEFKGTFDGGHFKINDLKITPTEQVGHTDGVGLSLTTEWGLFGRIGQGAVVKDLTINGVTITPWVDEASARLGEVYANVYDNFVGGAIGLAENAKEISGITVQGRIDIIGNQYLGAVVGRMNTNEKGYQDGVDTKLVGNTVRAAAGSRIQGVGYYIGGVVGWAACTDMIDNVVSGDLQLVNDYYAVYREGTTRADYFTIEGHIGGLAGLNQGNVEIRGNRIEGVTIKTVWLYETSQDFKRVGALLGSYGWGQIAIKNNVMSNVVIDSPNAVFSHNGLVGYYKDREGELIMQDNTASLLWRGVGYSLEKGEEKGVWTVGDANQLRALAIYVNGSTAKLPAVNGTRVFGWDSGTNGNEGLVQPILGYNFAGETVVLTGDVELGGENWTPLKEFAGTFKGKTGDETITGLTITTDSEDKAQYKYGFISQLTGTVSDVVFREVEIYAPRAEAVGAVAARSVNGSISNVKVFIKDICGYQWVGGLVGYGDPIVATGNEVSGSIRYQNYKAGGIVGIVHGQGNLIEKNKLHDLTISSFQLTYNSFDYIGGLCGGTSEANGGVTMNENTFENVTLDGSKATLTGSKDSNVTGDMGALMGNVGDGPYYSSNNSGTVTVIPSPHTKIYHKGLWGRDRADLVNSDNPKLTVDWNGIMVTQESYALDSADDLKLFRDWVNGGMTFAGEKVVLTGDINLSYKSWTPIGTTTTPFKGTFDGTKTKIADGKVTEVYTIRNLMVSGNDHVGLFGQVGQYGEANNVRLENLRIENVQVKANGTAGGGVSIIGCAGALAGELIGGVVNNVTVTGRVVITSSGSDVGGVVGKAYGSFTDVKVEPTDLAYVRGESTDDSHYANNVGGILGWWGENEFSMTGCVSKIEVEGPAYVGGLVGTILGGNMTISGTVEAEIKTHSPNGFGDMMGAFFGYALNNATVTVRGSSFSGSLLKESNILFTSLGNDGAGGTAYNNATLNAYDTTVQIDIAEGFDRYAVWDEGGVCSHIFRVKSAKGLANFSAIVSGSLKNCQAYSFEGETVELTEPIDLNNENFTPIGTSYSKAFAGNFNGNGNTISNLNVVGNDNNGSTRIDYLGLFGCVYTKNSAVTIESFTLRNVTVSSDVNLAGSHSAYVGAVIGQGWTQGLTLSKIKVEGTLSIEGGNTVGGFAGALSGIDVGLSVKDVEISATNGTVTSEAGVGGIVCTIPSTCKATTMESITVSGVTLVGGSGNIGGIVGSVSYKLDIKTVTLTDVIITPYNGKTATDSNPKADSEVGAVLGNWSAGYACTITGAKGNVTVRAPESENPIKATRYNNGITGINTGSNTENVTITDCDGLTVKWYED